MTSSTITRRCKARPPDGFDYVWTDAASRGQVDHIVMWFLPNADLESEMYEGDPQRAADRLRALAQDIVENPGLSDCIVGACLGSCHG